MGFWDTCAANCLLKEIGGGFYYFDGTEIDYDISNKKISTDGFFIFCASQERKNIFLDVYKRNQNYFTEYFTKK